jgi:hypothetical protein
MSFNSGETRVHSAIAASEACGAQRYVPAIDGRLQVSDASASDLLLLTTPYRIVVTTMFLVSDHGSPPQLHYFQHRETAFTRQQ